MYRWTQLRSNRSKWTELAPGAPNLKTMLLQSKQAFNQAYRCLSFYKRTFFDIMSLLVPQMVQSLQVGYPLLCNIGDEVFLICMYINNWLWSNAVASTALIVWDNLLTFDEEVSLNCYATCHALNLETQVAFIRSYVTLICPDIFAVCSILQIQRRYLGESTILYGSIHCSCNL